MERGVRWVLRDPPVDAVRPWVGVGRLVVGGALGAVVLGGGAVVGGESGGRYAHQGGLQVEETPVD